MRKKILSNKEKRELNKSIEKYLFQFDKKDIVEAVEEDKYKVIKSNNEALFFYYGDKIIPSLKIILKQQTNLKKIVVDMGAVKYVVSGADVMRPGIVDIDDGIMKDESISVVDVNNKKPLAIGIALLNSEEMRRADSGKVVKNIHFIGDEIWNA